MPCTAIEIIRDGISNKIKFISQPNSQYLELLIYYCDDKFIPIGNPEHNASEMKEEEYHRKLRLAANEKGQFVPSQSTNPEWNPDYVEFEEIPNAEL